MTILEVKLLKVIIIIIGAVLFSVIGAKFIPSKYIIPCLAIYTIGVVVGSLLQLIR